MVIDLGMLAVFLSLSNVMQVIALSVQYVMNRKQPGLLWWLLGVSAIAVGFLLNYLRAVPALTTLTIFLNNVFFIAGMACLYVGVLRFFGKRENRRALLLFGAIFFALFFFFTFVSDNFTARRAVLYVALAVLTFLTTRALWVYKTRAVTVSANFLALVFFVSCIFYVVRGVLLFFGGAGEDLFSATAPQVATYVMSLVTTTLWTFGFVLLVNQRLSQASLEAQEQLELMFNTETDATVLTRLRDGMVIRVNDGYTALTGYTREETVGNSILGLNLWKNIEERRRLAAMFAEKGYYDNQEVVFQRKDGSEVFVVGSGKMLLLNDEPHILTVTRDITERKRAEAALRESEAKHRVLFQDSPDAYLILADGIFVDCNRATENMLRGNRAQIVGKTPDALSPEFQPDGQKSSAAAAEKIRIAFELGSTGFEWMHRRLDGTDFWVEVSVAAITFEGKSAMFTSWRDITERKRSEALIRAHLELMQYANDHALPEVLQKTLDVASELTGSSIGFYHFVESDQQTLSLQGWSTRTRQEFCHAEGEGMHYPIEQAGVWADCVRAKAPVIHNDYASLPNRKGMPEGHAQVVRELVVPILRGEQVVGILGVGNKASDYTETDVALIQYFADVAWEITERKRLEEELQEQAITDVLTGAFNRRRFIELAAYELKRAARLEIPPALAIIDIDHFKQVNDTYGHVVGDQVLQTFTRICQENIREMDVFARFGGDEFAMLLPSTDGKQAYQIIERIRAAIAAKPALLDGKSVPLTISAGIASAQNGTTLDDLVAHADRALYESKTRGRNFVTMDETK